MDIELTLNGVRKKGRRPATVLHVDFLEWGEESVRSGRGKEGHPSRTPPPVVICTGRTLGLIRLRKGLSWPNRQLNENPRSCAS